MNGLEYAAIAFNEIKTDSEPNGDMLFSGYGAIFGNMDYVGDVIVPGAFAESLAESQKTGVWPPMLSQHGGLSVEDNMPIGIWTALSEDGVGLKVEGKLAPTDRGKEHYALLKMTPRPAISGLSIGYRVKEAIMRSRPEDPARKLIKIDLKEISLVTFPANTKARVTSVKSGLTKRDAEKALREAGFSREESKAIIAEGFNFKPLRDAGGDRPEIENLRKLIGSMRS